MTHKNLMPNTWQVSFDDLLEVVREVCTVYSYEALTAVGRAEEELKCIAPETIR